MTIAHTHTHAQNAHTGVMVVGISLGGHLYRPSALVIRCQIVKIGSGDAYSVVIKAPHH